ncbi:4416_t:CDS:2, partial [Diversispora eburnea]
MSYEDKSKLTKFTEPPSISNSIIKMWVLLEGSQRAVKLKADLSEAKDLDDFALILKREFEKLKKVEPEDILFLDSNNTPIRPGINLKSLSGNSTDENPLIVRYPLSNANVVVNYTFGHKPGKCKIQHTTGSLSSLREAVVEKFN